jgi:hypothetical protein
LFARCVASDAYFTLKVAQLAVAISSYFFLIVRAFDTSDTNGTLAKP